ncbi:BMC domain-containing protein [Deltaproteobacteria bacterium OttesenSCG-928-M10]|nr:BMC domain-containing protein [Deltaproteobacteria bacterium OttesenSCG-928-M10]
MRKTSQALGLIETRGLTPLVTALDGAIKAAQVTFEGRRLVGGGLVNATVTGDVGAVRAAMDAADGIIRQMGAIGMTHVIARPDEAVWAMLKKDGLNVPGSGEPSPADQSQTGAPVIRPEAMAPALRAATEVPAVAAKKPAAKPKKPRKPGGKK